MILLSSAYLGPVYYYSRFFIPNEQQIIIEQHDHYLKQTYRNRCIISGANGILSLSIPVKKPDGNNTKVKDVLIDYDTNWQKNHYRAIISAYRSAPFFEFYFDDFEPFYRKKINYLIDLNLELSHLIAELLGSKAKISLSDHFTKPLPYNSKDYRDSIHPKKDHCPGNDFHFEEYMQVFSERSGFLKNLSIIDLLFNKGQEAGLYLKKNYSGSKP